MDDRQANSYAAFQRALQCIARHPTLRDKVDERRAAVHLQEFVDTIQRLAAKQKYAELRSKELTLAEGRVKKQVRLLLDQVSAMADLVIDEGGRIFRAPNDRSSTQDVILICRAFAQAAESHEAEFVELGASPTFIGDLLDAAIALERAVADRVDLDAEGCSATDGLKEAVSRGSKWLGVVDSVYTKFMTTEMRAEWRQAIRMGRVHRPKRAPALPAQTAPEPIAIEEAPAQQAIEEKPAQQAIEEAPAQQAIEAPTLKALPNVSALESILVRLLRQKQPVENPKPDVSVSEIPRLPPKSSAGP